MCLHHIPFPKVEEEEEEEEGGLSPLVSDMRQAKVNFTLHNASKLAL